MILLEKFCLFWGHNFHKKQTTPVEFLRENGAFSLALSLLNSLTNSSNPRSPGAGRKPGRENMVMASPLSGGSGEDVNA